MSLSKALGRRVYAYPFALLLVVFIGVVSRIAYVDRPMDHRSLNAWREADYTQVTRNFYRGDMNILYPQIDWRGDTPGFVEMEFPIVPWMAAGLDRIFGYRESMVRVPSLVASLLALLLFAWLASRMLPPVGALFATTAFAVNPLLVHLSVSMQPEAMTLFWSLCAMALIWRWNEAPRHRTLLAACTMVAAATLCKSPAAYLGLVCSYVVLRKQGWQAFRDPINYGGAFLMILPPMAWYAWAHQFWLAYGNSLGLSNESHFLGWDMLLPPKFLVGNLRTETINVFSPAGWLLAIAGAAALPVRARIVWVWLISIGTFYLVAARTSGDDWAYYYHSHSVAPVSILMGAGVAALHRGWLGAFWPRLKPVMERRILVALSFLTILSLALVTVRRIDQGDRSGGMAEMHYCAKYLQQYVEPNSLIVVRGGGSTDEYGKPVAFNESMVFTWMDRKGFNYPKDKLTEELIESIRGRGGSYWFLDTRDLDKTELKRSIRSRYKLVAECNGIFMLYDISHP